MAKLAFSKLGLKVPSKNVIAEFYPSFSGEMIELEVKTYLPIEEKMALISNVLNNCQDDNNFLNPAKFSMYFALEVIFKYTNLSFTEKQRENLPKLYDMLASNDVIEIVYGAIPKDELTELYAWAKETAQNVYTYRNSVYGILDAVGSDYSSLDLDTQKIREQLGDTDNLNILRDVLTKMG